MAFDDIGALKKTEFFEDSGLGITKNAEGNYILTQKLGSEDMGMPSPQAQADSAGGQPGGAAGVLSSSPDSAAAAGAVEDAEFGAQMMEGMAAMFAGLRIAMTVVVPGEVIESNATRVEGNRASWVFDIEDDPQVLNKLQSQEELRVVFAGEGVEL